MTADEILGSSLRRLGAMTAARALFDTYWLRIGELVLPRQQIFLRAGPIPEGERRTEKIFDSTPEGSLYRFAAAIESLLTPRTQLWHGITPAHSQLKNNRRVKLYCDQVRDILFDARYSPRANFEGQTGEHYIGTGAFGTAGLFIDEELGANLRYHSCHLSELYIAQNHQGNIDTTYRKFVMTARQCMQKFGKDKLPQAIVNAADKNPDREFDILHCVQPNEEIQAGRSDSRGMKFASHYIALEPKALIETGGYRSFPYAFSRHVVAPREVYGRSPAMQCLADINTLNEMNKDILRQAQLALSPPVLLSDMDDGEAFDMRPGAQNYGRVSADGKPMVLGFQTGANFEIGKELLDDRRDLIRTAFYGDLFQVLVDNPNMTATQVLELAQERGQLIAPTAGRAQAEFLGAVIEREIDLLAYAGQLPPMPPELQERGGAILIEYTSPLNRMMRAGEAAGLLRTIEGITPLAQADPTVLHVFDGQKIARGMADINGVPEEWLRSEDDVAAMAEQAAQQQALTNLVTAAPQVASAAKDLTAAQATAQNQPANQPGAGT